MIDRIEDYFTKGCGRCDRFDTPDCSTRHWFEGLRDLRKVCLDSGMTEHVKWGHPCYVHANRNVAIMGAFRSDFRLSFFHAALMKDPDQVLEKQGENTQHPDMIRFTDNSHVLKMKSTISSYLSEAMAYAEQGLVAKKVSKAIELPEELVEAMNCDPELAEAFSRLTPGRQRSYVINLGSAKKSETRVARISKFRTKILAGKGALER